MSKYFDTQKLSFMAPEIKESDRHLVMTNVHKDVHTKYVNIDTRFQDHYRDDRYTDIKCALPQSIINVQSLRVTNIELPISFYNFSLQRKNTFFVVENSSGTRMRILLDDGNYDFSTLTGEINDKLVNGEDIDNQVLGITDLSLTIDSITQKIKIRNTSTTESYTLHFDVDEYGKTDRNNFKSKLGWALGFRSPSYVLNAGTAQTPTDLYSETFVNVHGHRYLYLSVDEYAQTNLNSFLTPAFNGYLNPNVLARISLDSNNYLFGSVLSAGVSKGNLLSDKRTYKGKTDIQRLHIQLLDEIGNPVDLNQLDFSFALEIEYI